MSDLNRFIVKFFCEDKLVMDISVDNSMCTNYVSALNISEHITFYGKKYKIKKVEMKHLTEEKLKIELLVNLKEVNEPSISILK